MKQSKPAKLRQSITKTCMKEKYFYWFFVAFVSSYESTAHPYKSTYCSLIQVSNASNSIEKNNKKYRYGKSYSG